MGLLTAATCIGTPLPVKTNYTLRRRVYHSPQMPTGHMGGAADVALSTPVGAYCTHENTCPPPHPLCPQTAFVFPRVNVAHNGRVKGETAA